MLRVHSIESRANAGAGVRSDTANPSKTHRQADRRIKFAPRELTQGGGALQVPSRPTVAVPDPESSGGLAGETNTLYATSGGDRFARNNLVHPIRRARIPAQISPSTPDESCRAAFTKLAPLNPEQMLLSTREVSSPTRRKHIVWWIVVAIYRAGNLPGLASFSAWAITSLRESKNLARSASCPLHVQNLAAQGAGHATCHLFAQPVRGPDV